MNGSTLILEFHSWRGASSDGGPFGHAFTLGFISVYWVPFLLSEWLRTKLDGMKNALKGSRFPEMDAFGEKE